MSAQPVPVELNALMVDCEMPDACLGGARFPAARWIEARCVYCGTEVKGFTCRTHWLRILAAAVPCAHCGGPLVKITVA